MNNPRKLEWGETPWDDLSKEELLREVWRMYEAVIATHSVLNVLSAGTREHDSFWGKQGSGGRALSLASQCIDPIYEKFDEESVYRSFFRYALPLLFEVEDREKWVICPACGDMWGGLQFLGKVCSEAPISRNKECKGVLRLLEWGDLEKK